VLQVKDALQRLTIAEYDAFGRPTKVTKPYDGAVVRTTATDYDLNDNVTKETAPNGAQSVSTYDAADNLLTKTLPDNNTTGRQLAYTYDVLGRKVIETAPKGVATTTDPNDFVTKYTYDRIGQVLKVETPFLDTDGSTKTPTTTYEYDLVGNRTTVIDPLRNASPATDYTSKTVYDLNHRPTAVTDAAGYTSKTVYDADGLVTAEINQTGNTKTTEYDEAGQPIAIHVPHTPIGAHQEDRVTRLDYDQAGNVTRQTRPSGRYSETVYDKNNRPVQNKSAFDTTTLYKTPSSTFIQYYPTGEIKAQSEPTFGSSGTQWTNFTYYGSGDIKTSTDPWQITATYGYNQLGRQTDRTLTVPGDDAKRTQAWAYYPDGALQSRSDTAAQQPVDIVDNADTWQTTSTGTWATATGGTNTQGPDYRTHAAAAVGTPEANDTFNWRVLPDVAGSFDVYASCPVTTGATTAATYTINHSTGAATKTVDQKACTAAAPWISLGNYSFPNGVAKTITLKPSATGVVSADANTNRYAFAGGNPITGIELDGHYAIDDNGRPYSSGPQPPATPPEVANATLKGILKDTYAKPGAQKVIGDGKAATALRYETLTGEMTDGRKGPMYHHTDVADLARRYSILLEADRKARADGKPALLTSDEARVARTEFADLWDALTGNDSTGKVSANIQSRGLSESLSNTMKNIRSTPAVADLTGEPFNQIPYKQPRIARLPSGAIFGRALGVAGLALDVPVATAAFKSIREGSFNPLGEALYGDMWQEMCYECPAPVS
jgi:YD repeat-containing protein